MEYLFRNLLNSFISTSCFICIYLSHKFLIGSNGDTLFIAAFGASAVLVFSNNAIKHSSFQVFFSSIMAAIIGIFWSQMDLDSGIKISLAISSSILIMNLMHTSYPPAGAITIIPLISNSEIQNLGYSYAIYPTSTGLIIIYLFSQIKEKLNTIYYGKSENN